MDFSRFWAENRDFFVNAPQVAQLGLHCRLARTVKPIPAA
jgi:hypothetical protein